MKNFIKPVVFFIYFVHLIYLMIQRCYFCSCTSLFKSSSSKLNLSHILFTITCTINCSFTSFPLMFYIDDVRTWINRHRIVNFYMHFNFHVYILLHGLEEIFKQLLKKKWRYMYIYMCLMQLFLSQIIAHINFAASWQSVHPPCLKAGYWPDILHTINGSKVKEGESDLAIEFTCILTRKQNVCG